MNVLLGEICEQPDVLQRVIDDQLATIQRIADEIRRRSVSAVLIAARGTSDNAGVYAKYLWGGWNRLPVMLAAPSLYTVYGTPPRLRDTLVVGISQSGMSPDVVTVAEDGRRQGMLTLAITNAPGSPLARACEYAIDCCAGEERSVAATKSYTAELMAIALLSAAIGDDQNRLREARAVPQAVREVLAYSGAIGERAPRYRYMAQCAVLGRGLNYASALEVALKVKELCYVGANPYSWADFRHGPMALVEPGYPVIVIAPSGAMDDDADALVADLRARQAELLVISDRKALTAQAQVSLTLPPMPEWLSPMTSVVPGQLLGYHLALAKGLDPVQPRNLRKVTETL